MLTISRFIYSLSLILYKSAIYIAAPFNAKAKEWISGRKYVFEELKVHYQNKTGKSIWMHCASLGEFEQGRPVLESLRMHIPGCKILLTFFSPSGYKLRKDYKGADYVSYLPLDSRLNASQFINIVKPDLALFVKYEFWYFYLRQLHSYQIPVILFSSIFRNSQPFFKWYGTLHRQMLGYYSKIFVQTEESRKLLEQMNIQSEVAGDTRFDRVAAIAETETTDTTIMNFLKGKPAIIGGSTWEPDERILKHAFNNLLHAAGFKLIIAPHDVNNTNIERIEAFFGNDTCRYSQNSSVQKNILILDVMGSLSLLYRNAKYVYIGGGFGKGLHNTLEAAVYGKPIFFGPRHKKFHEAISLVKIGAAFEVKNANEIIEKIAFLEKNSSAYSKVCVLAKEYVLNNTGGTKKIVQYIQTIKVN